MYTGKFKIAGKTAMINSIYEDVQNMCAEYLTDEQEKFHICTEKSDIDYERMKSEREDKKEGIPVRKFADGYLETLAVYRKLCGLLLDENRLLFHGSVVAVDGKGYLFTAKSGTGKSTHTRLWREYFGERAVMVNDDKPILELTENGVLVHGTPWDGKHHLSSNISVPLKAICILERSEDNSIESLTPRDAFPMLLQQTHRPAESGKMSKTLEFVGSISKKVPLYRLKCNMKTDAVITAYRGINGGIL